MKKICLYCGKEFNTYNKKQNCCSRRCGGLYMFKTGKKKYTREERKCKVCGKLFFVVGAYKKIKTRGKYCSDKCSRLDHKAEEKYTCIVCGKKFDYAHGYKTHTTICSFKCASIKKSKEWEIAREACLFRDHYTCQICGVKKGTTKFHKEIKLEVHHKDETGSNVPAKEMNNDLDNLITLCHQCHMTEEIKLKGGSFKSKLSKEEWIKRNNNIYDLFRNGKSQTEISKMMGITRQRVNQIIYRILL